MLGLFGDMARLPWTVLLFATRQMVETMERWAPAATPPVPAAPPPPRGDRAHDGWDNRPAAPPVPKAIDKEDRNVADSNLNDDDVKLVQYAIVSIERRKEKVLTPPSYHLVKGRTEERAFSSARIADLVRDSPDEVKDRDLDDLRVYFDVLARWPKSDLKYEEKTLGIEEEKLGYLRKMVGK